MKGRALLSYATILMFLLGTHAARSQSTASVSDKQPQANEVRAAQPQEKSVVNTGSPQDFVNMAAQGSMFEVKLADLAMQRSDNAEIDKLAGQVKADHQKANEQLKSLASEKGWKVPATITDAQQEKIEKLQKTSDEDFDETYLEIMADAHQSTISTFEKCAEKKEDAQLSVWATNTLPVLKKHLQDTKALASRTASKMN